MTSAYLLFTALVVPVGLTVCIATKILPPSQELDPSTVVLCRDNPCLNQGICVENKSAFLCHCSVGYNGTYCESDLNPPSFTKYAEVNMKDGGTIKCDVTRSCSFPLFVQPKDGDIIKSFMEGPENVDSSVQIATSPLLISKGNEFTGMSSHDVTIDFTEEGTRKLCFTLKGEVPQKVCYDVEATRNEESSGGSSIFLQHFIYPNGSRLMCDSFCHMMIVTDLTGRNSCVPVKTQGNSSWTFPSFNDKATCYTEIVYTAQPCGSQLCIEAGGDVICYTTTKGTGGVTASTKASIITNEHGAKLSTDILTSKVFMSSTDSVESVATSFASKGPFASNLCDSNEECQSNMTGYFCICPQDLNGTLCNQTSSKIPKGLSVAVIATTVAVSVTVVGGVAGVVLIKTCPRKCSLKKLADVSPIGDPPCLNLDDTDEEESENEDKGVDVDKKRIQNGTGMIREGRHICIDMSRSLSNERYRDLF